MFWETESRFILQISSCSTSRQLRKIKSRRKCMRKTFSVWPVSSVIHRIQQSSHLISACSLTVFQLLRWNWKISWQNRIQKMLCSSIWTIEILVILSFLSKGVWCILPWMMPQLNFAQSLPSRTAGSYLLIKVIWMVQVTRQTRMV